MRYQPRGPFQMQNSKCKVQNEQNESAILHFAFSNLHFLRSVNAKQLAQPAFQVGPSRCKSGHGCHFVRVAQLDQSATVRRWRSQVQFLPWTPFCLCASASHRTSFVNLYSSVRVRPEAPIYGDHDVTAASRPVKAFVPVRIRLVTPISMGRR